MQQLKALLFCTAYLNDKPRYQHWVEYYLKNQSRLKVDCLFLIDDGSTNLTLDIPVPYQVIVADDGLPNQINCKVCIVTFREHYGRPGTLVYPGWWRSFTFSSVIAEYYGCPKIIHIESDFYVLSQRMLNYLAGLSTGWNVLWSRKYLFPETAIQVICGESIDRLKAIHTEGREFFFSSCEFAEKVLQFTHIEKRFIGDRFGEPDRLKGWWMGRVPKRVDYVGQVVLTHRGLDHYRPVEKLS